jgi:opacity protein-like surface antigen
MQTYKRLYLLGGLFVGLFATHSYSADFKEWYFGLSLSNSMPQLEVPGLKYIGRTEEVYSIISRYRLPLSGNNQDYFPLGNNPSLKNNAALHNRIVQLAGTASLPVTDKLGLYGRLGVSRSNDTQIGCYQSLLTCSFSDRVNDVSYGIGLRYDFTKSISLQGEWERLKQLNGNEISSDRNRSLFSVGVGFKF